MRANKITIFCIISFVIAILAIVSIVPLTNEVIACAYTDEQTGYDIYSQQDFIDFISYASGKTFADKYINFFCDVDAKNLSFTFADGFAGKINGYGYSIKNLTKPLFGTVASTGEINDVTLELDTSSDGNPYCLASTFSGKINFLTVISSAKREYLFSNCSNAQIDGLQFKSYVSVNNFEVIFNPFGSVTSTVVTNSYIEIIPVFSGSEYAVNFTFSNNITHKNSVYYNGTSYVVFDGTGVQGTDVSVLVDFTTEYAPIKASSSTAPTLGNGTAQFPYGVETFSQLEGIEQGATAVAIKDLIKLSTDVESDVDFYFDGNGYSLTDEKGGRIFETISGSLSDFSVLAKVNAEFDGVLSQEITSTGKIENIYLYATEDTASNKALSAFTVNNYGEINRCENHVSATYAFAKTNAGTLNYCIDYVDSDNLLGTNNGSSEKNLSTTKDDCSYDTLLSAEYDMSIIGYEVGQTLEYPTIRKAGVTYRKDNVKEEVILGNVTYSEYDGTVWDKEDIESDIYPGEYEYVEYQWKCDGEELTEDTFSDVGVYQITVTVGAGETYLKGYEEVKTFEIIKANAGISFDFGNAFSDLEYDYVGTEISIDEPIPNNQTELNGYGFNDLVYTLSSTPFDVGTYTQTVKAESKNYNDISLSRKITVKRVILTVNASLSVEYDGEFNLEDVVTTISGKVGIDANKNFTDLLTESGETIDCFTTNYEKGNDVGEYPIECEINELTNYTVVLESGIITVNKAQIDLGSAVFEDLTVEYDGEEKSVFVENLADGLTVTYDNNGKKDVGEYTITATISKNSNYEEEVVTAVLLIEKATITVKASDVEISYGSEYRNSWFTVDFSGIKGSDDISVINGENTFTIKTDFVEGDVPNAGEYEVDVEIVGEPVGGNYVYTIEKGSLKVNKVYLTAIYKNNSGNENTDFDDKSVEYSGTPTSLTLTAFSEEEVNISYEYKKGGNIVTECLSVGEYVVTATVEPYGETAINYVTTEYKCTLTITKIRTKIKIENERYYFTYANVNYAVASNFNYTTEKIPEGAEITFSCNPNVAKDVGNYVITFTYAGDENYYESIAHAVVEIEKAEVSISIKDEFEYQAKAISMQITSINYDNDELDGLVTTEQFNFSYTEVNTGGSLSYIAGAGNYRVSVECTNNNFTLATTEFFIEVTKRTVNLTIGELNFIYGSSGEMITETGTFYVYNSYVEMRNYYVEELESYTNVAIRLNKNTQANYFSAGTYILTEADVIEHANYNFTLSGTNTIVVERRLLSVIWYVDNIQNTAQSAKFAYKGEEQTDRITYKLVNYAVGDEESVTINRSIKYGAGDAVVYNAGQYLVKLSIENNANYVLDESTNAFALEVVKVTLKILMSDAIVMQYENFTVANYTISGLVGEDVDKSVYTLAGFYFKLITDYDKLTARVGEKYSIGGEFKFTNYIVNEDGVSNGTLTVIEGYPTYYMKDASFVYDGAEKEMVIDDVEEGTTVVYENNVNKYAGEYNVIARITYPSGRTTAISAKMTITKASPIVSSSEAFTAYQPNVKVSNFLRATATLNALVPMVDGTVSLVNQDAVLEKGRVKYRATFTPQDGYNFKEVNFDFYVTAYELDGSLLNFNGDYQFVGDECKITSRLMINLDKTNVEGIANDLTLLKNGKTVERIIIEKTETFSVGIAYKGTELYSSEIKTVLVTTFDEEVEKLEINYKMLEINGGEFSEDGKTIYVNKGDTLRMNSKYSGEYSLYVDGKIKQIYTFTGEEEKINVIIKNIDLGISMYSLDIVVVNGDKPEKPIEGDTDGGENVVEEDNGFKTYYYYIIGGAVALIITAVVLIVVLKKKK